MNTLGAPIEAVVQVPPDDRYPGDWRVMKGMTQPQLAAAARLPTVTIQRLERGEHPLSPENADVLAALLTSAPTLTARHTSEPAPGRSERLRNSTALLLR